MKKIFNLLMVGLVLSFTVACGDGADAGESGADATKTPTPPATEVTKTPTSADATEADPNVPKTSMEFDNMTHDFGTIDEGDKVEHVFKFKNSGDEPLIINSAKGSCGCTVPEWPKEPVAPGGEGEIKVVFNSKGKKNKQTKTVTINANTDPNPTRLTIKAQVTPAEGEAADAGKKDIKINAK